jgi:hypothetical protein
MHRACSLCCVCLQGDRVGLSWVYMNLLLSPVFGRVDTASLFCWRALAILPLYPLLCKIKRFGGDFMRMCVYVCVCMLGRITPAVPQSPTLPQAPLQSAAFPSKPPPSVLRSGRRDQTSTPPGAGEGPASSHTGASLCSRAASSPGWEDACASGRSSLSLPLSPPLSLSARCFVPLVLCRSMCLGGGGGRGCQWAPFGQ